MPASFEDMLKGGHPNSLGRTLQVVEMVEHDPSLMEELYACYRSEDEVVRLRTSNAFKRITKSHKDWVTPYLDKFLHEISELDQASARWTLAQICLLMTYDMTAEQMNRAKEVLKHNLTTQTDWIVLTQTMETLGKWAKKDIILKKWMLPHLEKHTQDNRKSVAGKAQKILSLLR
ncbi:MAG: hypothetical protein AAF824_03535 [Bacteroidota bacterium]